MRAPRIVRAGVRFLPLAPRILHKLEEAVSRGEIRSLKLRALRPGHFFSKAAVPGGEIDKREAEALVELRCLLDIQYCKAGMVDADHREVRRSIRIFCAQPYTA